jgi:hypothetical protein
MNLIFLQTKYFFYYVQRTNDFDDGLIILVDKNNLKVIDKYDLLNNIGNRIGLSLNIEFNGKCLLLIDIHLIFPHNSFDR